jgi:hypothetical protein
MARKVTTMTETVTGRAIVFSFLLKDGSRRSVTLDLFGQAPATYGQLEANVLAAMIRAGHDIDTWTHAIFD